MEVIPVRWLAGICQLALLSLVATLLLTGCSKSAKTEPPKTVDLSVVDLTLGSPSRHDLGDGNVCLLRAESLGPATIELVATLEKGGKEIASARALPVTVEKPLSLSLGNFQLQLIPRIQR